MQLKNPLGRLNLVLWQPLAGYGSGLVVALALLVYRLGTLLPGFSLFEKVSMMGSHNLTAIARNPVFGFHKFLQYLALKAGHNGYIAMRLPSVLFGLAAISLLFYVVNRWFNSRIAVITSILFATSSWFLVYARMASPEVSLLGLLAPLAYTTWLPRTKRPIPALVIGSIILVYMLHTPGFIWFVIFGLIWQRTSLANAYKEAKIPALLAISVCLIVSVPLISALASDRSLLAYWLGLPDKLNLLRDVPKNLVLIPSNLAVRGPTNIFTNLGRLPLIDFFTSIMAIIGGYSYITHIKLRRSRLLIGCLILGCLVSALHNNFFLVIVLPFVYLLVAGGMNFMIEQWFMVFPYNPLARGVATILLVVGVSVTSFYHLNRYFIAWPQTPQTRQVYHYHP